MQINIPEASLYIPPTVITPIASSFKHVVTFCKYVANLTLYMLTVARNTENKKKTAYLSTDITRQTSIQR